MRHVLIVSLTLGAAVICKDIFLTATERIIAAPDALPGVFAAGAVASLLFCLNLIERTDQIGLFLINSACALAMATLSCAVINWSNFYFFEKDLADRAAILLGAILSAVPLVLLFVVTDRKGFLLGCALFLTLYLLLADLQDTTRPFLALVLVPSGTVATAIVFAGFSRAIKRAIT